MSNGKRSVGPLVLKIVPEGNLWHVFHDGRFFALGLERDWAINEGLRQARHLVQDFSDPSQFRFDGLTLDELAAGIARLRAWLSLGQTEMTPDQLVERFRMVDVEPAPLV